MDDILNGINAVGSILYNIMLRISPTKVADFIVSKGRTYGKLLAPEEAFGILSHTPVELRDGILSSIGDFLKFKKAVDNNDSEEFVRLCESCDNVSNLLYACGYINEYLDAQLTLDVPDEHPFDTAKVAKNAYAVGYEPSANLLIEALRKMVGRIPDLAPYMTMDESEELDKLLLGFRSHKEYYTVILEEFIQYDSELQTIREEAIKEYGEDEIERQFVEGHSIHRWHLPTDLEEYKNFKSFFKRMPETTRDAIYSNIHGFENLIEGIATFGLIEDTESAKNTLAQLLLGKDLGYSGNLPLPFSNPKILCYLIAKIYEHRGFSKLKEYFKWTTLNEENKPFDTDKQCTSYAESCEGKYKSLVSELFPESIFPEK